MKLKPLKIVFEPLEEFERRTTSEMNEAVQGRKRHVQPRNLLVFASFATYQNIMSDNKYALLAAVYKHKPKTVYQLAKVLDRPIQNVFRDCEILEGHGFIKLVKSYDARNSKRPKLAFDYNAIVIYLPKVTYRVEFEDMAA